jgi:chromosome segregation ATPase
MIRVAGDAMSGAGGVRALYSEDFDEVDMDDGIGKLQSDVTHIRIEITDIKADLRQLNAQADATKSELAQSRLETEKAIGALRTDMERGHGTLRVDMEKGFGSLRGEMAALRTDIERSHGALRADMEKGQGALRADIGSLRMEMEKGDSAVRMELAKLVAALRMVGLAVSLLLGGGVLTVIARVLHWI